MARKVRIAAVCLLVAMVVVAIGVWGAIRAARQVRPFYQQALAIQPDILQRGSRELESQATVLYSDARKEGRWHALFTAEQINGWLATQLTAGRAGKLPDSVREPRVAIGADTLTLGFATTQGGVNTVVSVDASPFLTEDGEVAIRFLAVRAGALPLPVMQVADEIATACQELKLPVRWTQQAGQPIALVNIGSEESPAGRRLYLDSIQLRAGELFVAGHTETGTPPPVPSGNEQTALEIAHRAATEPGKDAKRADR